MIIENQHTIMNKKRCCYRPHRWIRPIIRCPCVLIYNNQAIPLKNVKYDVAINGGLANVTLSQEYFNTHNTPINVEYKFPVNENVVFGGIEAVFRNRKVKGMIKEKSQAKMEFEVNKALGNTVAYAEQLEETEDIMKVKLGNFPPNEPLTIVFKYMTRLDVFNEVNWGFRIPATLTPRFNPGTTTDLGVIRNQAEGSNVSTLSKYSVQQRYTWEINVNICWPGGAKNVVCMSHGDRVIVSKNPGIINVKFNSATGPAYPNKDFELMIEDSNLFSNNCQVAMSDLPTITGSSPKYAAMLQFVPSLYKWYADKGVNMDEGIDLYSDDNNDFLMENTLAEYIFVIDRSGSMRGDRMEKAKRALIFFLKSLPYYSRFNVISFGNSFQSMFPTSVEYNNNNLSAAISQISGFTANMGGTNILGPIQNGFMSEKIPNCQRNIFLLTDGAVSNTSQVLNTIESNCIYNQARVFSIGIGNGCSELLVKRSAKLGNGRSVIIADNDNVEGKVINLLQDSFTPSLTNFSVEFDPKYICALAPMPNQHSHVTRGEPFTMYALIKNDIEQAPDMKTQVKVSFYDSVEKKNETRVFNLSLNGCIVSDAYHKMCVKQLIESQKRVINTSYLDPVLAKVPSISTKLAVAYQVLSAEHTAFICVIHQNQGGSYIPSKNVIVPTLESVDYEEGRGYGQRIEMAMMSSLKRGGIRKMKKCKKRSKGGRGGRGGAVFTSVNMSNHSSPMGMMQRKSANFMRAMPEMKMMATKKSRPMPSRNKKRSMNSSIQRPMHSEVMMKGRAMELEMEMAQPRFDSLSFNETRDNHTTSLSGGNLTNDIVISQDIRGQWAFNQQLLQKVGANQGKLQSISAKVNNQDCLMTIVMLAWLLLNADQNTVGIIVNKGMGYLRKNNIAGYKELVEEAKSVF